MSRCKANERRTRSRVDKKMAGSTAMIQSSLHCGLSGGEYTGLHITVRVK